MKNPFTYEIPATADRLAELYDTLSPIETMPDGVTRDDFIAASLTASASYAVLIDGHLAGIALVKDFPDHREMGFAKSEYLTTSRRITFAKAIPLLFANINWAEAHRYGDNAVIIPPLYIHTPDGDDRSRDWFIRAGCTPAAYGLKVPNFKEKF